MKPSRDEIERLFWRKLDGELQPEDALRLEAALDEDPTLRDELEELTLDHAVLGAAFEDHPLGDALTDQIFAALETERARDRETRPQSGSPFATLLGSFRAPQLFAAAALLLASLALLPGLLDDSTDPNSSDPSKTKPGAMIAARIAAAGEGELAIRSASGGWQTLPAGCAIDGGATIRNQGLTPATLALDDGSRLTLRAETNVRVGRGSDGGVLVDLADSGGEILCQVAKVKPGEGPFRVKGHRIDVTVLGTTFTVRSFNGLTRVVVLEGKVRCETAAGETRLLTRGQEAELSGSGRLELGESDLARRAHWLGRQAPRELIPEPRPTEKPVRPADPSNDPDAMTQPDRPTDPADRPDRPMGRPDAPEGPNLPERGPDDLDLPVKPPSRKPSPDLTPKSREPRTFPDPHRD